jgi:acyl-coenzyme A synthetase/AMP-(fatty) acid ligase
VLWYKYGTRDWQTDGDKFRDENGVWFYTGRAFDDVIFMKGGVKIYTGLVEALALEVPGVVNVASCSKNEIHYVIYTGDALAYDLAQHYKGAQPSKRPHDIYHVTDALFFGQTDSTRTPQKLQKSKLVDVIMAGDSKHRLEHVSLKDHTQV